MLEVVAIKKCFIKNMVIAAKRRCSATHLIDQLKLSEYSVCWLSNLSWSDYRFKF